ncbi:hypothetical protein HYX12_04605 [Candidatus Woesearchaeota archaeon]|nr:hypothetical protein [Candidatus Woesearchaeota archaeon]
MRSLDLLSKKIIDILDSSDEPLETRELELLLEKETRIKILYRLNILRGDGAIKGKAVGSGKGCWIWWRTKIPTKNISSQLTNKKQRSGT